MPAPDGLGRSDPTVGGETSGRGLVRVVAAVAEELSASLDLKNSKAAVMLFQNVPFPGGAESLSAIEP